jgi:pimeloyl-ACP methyl ester carboxylesterase
METPDQMSQPSLREVRVRGGLLPVWTQTGGPTALVFLHYWGGSRRTFAPVIASLSSRWTVVVYDQRGWGAARDLPGPYGINQLADDVIDVVGELGISRYVLVGHSMGGKVAQLAASRNPEGLAGVVLVAPAPPRPAVDADAVQRRSHAYDSRESISDALQRVLTYRPLAAGLREQVITDSLAGNPDALLAWPLHGITENITGPAGLIKAPVQVLAGRYDLVDPPASLEANLLPVIPGARMTVLDGTGHLSPLEVPDQIANEIDEFVATMTLPTAQ